MSGATKEYWINLENTIIKDVIRTDRYNPFFAGERNLNLEVMK